MSPDDLTLIHASGAAIDEDPNGFSDAFYVSVFAIAPEARSLFPDDLGEQRKKLTRELQFMLAAAWALDDETKFEAFVERTKQLGRRHVGYGVTAAMYEPVGAALIATLRLFNADFDERHVEAWTKLFGFISETMLAGAAEAARVAPAVVKPQPLCQQCIQTIRTTPPMDTGKSSDVHAVSKPRLSNSC